MKPKILLVDDEPDALEVLGFRLREAGFARVERVRRARRRRRLGLDVVRLVQHDVRGSCGDELTDAIVVRGDSVVSRQKNVGMVRNQGVRPRVHYHDWRRDH